MCDLILDLIDQMVKKNQEKDEKISKLLIGHGFYNKLMANPRFAEEVISSALDPDERSYRGVRIKVTHNEYELTFLTENRISISNISI
jgi:hypothetical protein